MKLQGQFLITANYWSQSETSKLAKPSHLRGFWRHVDLLDRAKDFLAKAAPRAPAIDLRAADIVERLGKFADISDALYYKANSSENALPNDILDCTKLVDLWQQRLPRLRELAIGKLADDFSTDNEEIAAIASSEYVLHEVGHRLGFNLFDKQEMKFFRIAGKLRWPLVFYEEHRADVNALAVSADFVPDTLYRKIVAFHMNHRLGLAIDSRRAVGEAAGLVPFLLIHFLLEHELISRNDGNKHGFRIEDDPRVISISFKHHAETLAKIDSHWEQDPLMVAIRQAEYVRKCIANDRAVSLYNEIVES